MPQQAKAVVLAASEKQELERIVQRGTDWRERQRAQIVLLLATGMTVVGVARQLGSTDTTVTRCRDVWLRASFVGLKDAPRSGAPRQLSPDLTAKLCAWAIESAHTAVELCVKLLAECQVTASPWVVRNALKLHGFVWKRTRHSLKKSVTKQAFVPHRPKSPRSSNRPVTASAP